MRKALEKFITKIWYKEPAPLWLCLFIPLSLLYKYIVFVRRLFLSFYFPYHSPAQLIVVGNITTGGTGKTPFIIEFAKLLANSGYHPGIISKGYGRKSIDTTLVTSKNDGEEPYLIATQTDLPVVVSNKRKYAIQHLLKYYSQVDVILSDDGLQDYSVIHDLEICMVDGEREFGNGYLLPLGPLREPLSRLQEVDLVIYKPGADFNISLAEQVYAINNPQKKLNLTSLVGQRCHVIAGIGNPESFFKMLRQHDINFTPHIFPDHHDYNELDLKFLENNNLPVLLTEKDAVKLAILVNKSNNCWVVPLTVQFSEVLQQRLLSKIWKKNYLIS